jgi:hypothetical protein
LTFSNGLSFHWKRAGALDILGLLSGKLNAVTGLLRVFLKIVLSPQSRYFLFSFIFLVPSSFCSSFLLLLFPLFVFSSRNFLNLFWKWGESCCFLNLDECYRLEMSVYLYSQMFLEISVDSQIPCWDPILQVFFISHLKDTSKSFGVQRWKRLYEDK